jgi:hypothetical protein
LEFGERLGKRSQEGDGRREQSWEREGGGGDRGWVEGKNMEGIGEDSKNGLGIDRGAGIVETGGRKGRGREGEGEGE